MLTGGMQTSNTQQIFSCGFTIGGASSSACSSGWLEEMDTPAFYALLAEKKLLP